MCVFFLRAVVPICHNNVPCFLILWVRLESYRSSVSSCLSACGHCPGIPIRPLPFLTPASDHHGTSFHPESFRGQAGTAEAMIFVIIKKDARYLHLICCLSGFFRQSTQGSRYNSEARGCPPSFRFLFSRPELYSPLLR